MTERDRERGEGREPIDEEAAWAAIVAGWDEEPAGRTGSTGGGEGRAADPPGPEGGTGDAAAGGGAVTGGPHAPREGTGDDTPADATGGDTPEPDADPGTPPAAAPVVNRAADWLAGAPGAGLPAGAPAEDGDKGPWNGPGPRDWAPSEEDEGHFVPPEPPPLPETDPTTRFAWLAVLGGPLLLILSAVLGFTMSWWVVTLGIGGFLGGFATLVMRMRDGRDDDDWIGPGNGAVV
ncbi:hypothetical protein GCM10027160_19390 [Streptomyces calidiresistens]|uniref:Uncharacterized protein n=1 Tax=Streptomyces calidiresistens TaxID=1485586 RepID=A0A7W3XXA9_9ACTN|nr:hypothetical protein [Streptomyces calidiresistens]MBB0230602.1 hypothetical protein [Streptomyces calidiresistens]